ncbi:hypothetical protein NDU88_000119 [Pleurodeles waltl]|uniref:Uncharacterized protein n=1 Tax=Pleurodeles waltl TaxID=8319 RepID=A0AAV7LTY7_PLEWA|nr:hypothetical protein NDU88_000119 [Pleurodeles waltl]
MLCGCVHDWCKPCSQEIRDAVRLRARLVHAILTRASDACGCVHDWCRPFSPELAMLCGCVEAMLTRASDAVRLRVRLVQAMLTGA